MNRILSSSPSPLDDDARIVITQIEVEGFPMSSIRPVHLLHLRDKTTADPKKRSENKDMEI